MSWRKIGKVYVPDGRYEWGLTHAANPVAEDRGDGIVRIYFGTRDDRNRTHVSWVEIHLDGERFIVVRVAEEPVLTPGPLGGFDDSGVSVGCVIPQGDRLLLYYLGWNLGVTVPWRNSIGLAVRTGPDGPFERHSPAPILDRADVDPFTLSYPCVVCEGGRWQMWYGSNLRWGSHESDMDHVIKYAWSDDGISWQRDGTIAIDLLPGEIAVCRPWVIREGDGWRMWFCYRGDAYRLGIATSTDGIRWKRSPESGLDVSRDGWDSEMIGYPSAFAHGGRRYLLYNGNRYGQTGFGLAIEE